MALPKIVWESKKDSDLQEKKIVEALIKRLNEKISTDTAVAKKAAAVLEIWLNQKPKKK